jgi:hypothetical protein
MINNLTNKIIYNYEFKIIYILYIYIYYNKSLISDINTLNMYIANDGI